MIFSLVELTLSRDLIRGGIKSWIFFSATGTLWILLLLIGIVVSFDMLKYCVYTSSSISSNILFLESKWVLDNESGINVDCWVWLVYSDTTLLVDGSCIYSLSGSWSSTSISCWEIGMSCGINVLGAGILIGGVLEVWLYVIFFDFVMADYFHYSNSWLILPPHYGKCRYSTIFRIFKLFFILL